MNYEQHTEGTGEVLRQLRAEREALTLQVEEQRRLLEEAVDYLSDTDPDSEFVQAITQHMKGKA